MEAISEKSFVKYSELIQENAEKEDEIFLTSSQKSMDALPTKNKFPMHGAAIAFQLSGTH